jgi:DNA-binding PadR family transcriptional regulator
VKSYLDVLILVEMKKQTCLTGYDVIEFVNKKSGEMISPGTVYSTLYLIERKVFIKGDWNGRKTIYTLTKTGKIVASKINGSRKEMVPFIESFFS